MTDNRTLDICVCTFRRPQLSETLTSLARLRLPQGYDVSIIVIDNDHEPSATGCVADFAASSPLPVQYVHCPAGNISIARNGALDASAARYLAFIDDDETATRDWLIKLTDMLETERSDVVLGPVQAIYDRHAPAWMRALDIHSTMPVWVGNTIETGYTCNVLIDRDSPATRGLRFDLALGQSGGEDTKFFSQLNRAGGTIAFAEDAVVLEPVPPSRSTFGWLAQRRFRMGQTHGRLLVEEHGALRRVKNIGAAMAKVIYCAGAAILQAPSAPRRNHAILRGAMHLGAVSGLIGVRELRLYKTDLTGASAQ